MGRYLGVLDLVLDVRPFLLMYVGDDDDVFVEGILIAIFVTIIAI